MTSPVFTSKRHDTAISPQLTFTPPPDLGWDLTEPGTVATLIARLPDSPTPKVNAPAIVVGPWTVRYDPIPADVNTIGAYDVEVQVVRPSGKKVTFPTEGYVTWRIVPDLDNS